MMNEAMDAYTVRHLDAWLDRVAYDDERDALRAAMLALVADDPELVDRGWPVVRELARMAS